jgi:pilus assembly protein TadC
VKNLKHYYEPEGIIEDATQRIITQNNEVNSSDSSAESSDTAESGVLSAVEMKAWLLERNIPFCDNMLKAQLYILCIFLNLCCMLRKVSYNFLYVINLSSIYKISLLNIVVFTL